MLSRQPCLLSQEFSRLLSLALRHSRCFSYPQLSSSAVHAETRKYVSYRLQRRIALNDRNGFEAGNFWRTHSFLRHGTPAFWAQIVDFWRSPITHFSLPGRLRRSPAEFIWAILHRYRRFAELTSVGWPLEDTEGPTNALGMDFSRLWPSDLKVSLICLLVKFLKMGSSVVASFNQFNKSSPSRLGE